VTTAEKAQLHLVLQPLVAADRDQVAAFLTQVLDKTECVLHPDVPTALAARETGRVLVLVETPMRELARRMAGGVLPAQALADWTARTDVLLAACRKDRRHVRLMTWDSLLAGDRASLDMLAEMVAQPVPDTIEGMPEEGAPDACLQVLAGVFLQGSDAPARHQIEGLLAGPGMEIGPALVAQAVQRSLAQDQAVADLNKQLGTAAQESAILRQGLKEMQEQLTAQETRAAQDNAALTKQTRAELDGMGGQLQRLTAERDLLQESLRDMSARVQGMLEGDAKLQAERTASLEQQLTSLRSERDLLTKTLSDLRSQMNQDDLARAEKERPVREALEARVMSLENERKLLRISLADLEAQSGTLEMQLSEREDQLSRKGPSEEQLAAVAKERDLLQASLAQAEAQKNTLNERVMSQGRQIQDMEAQLVALSDVTVERDLLRESLDGQRQEVAVSQEDFRRAEDRLLEMQMVQSSNEALSRQAERAEQDRLLSASALGAVLLDDSLRMRDLQGQLDQTWGKLSQTKTMLDATEQALEQQKQAREASEAEHGRQSAETQAVLQEREAYIAHLTAELDKIYGSKSWRVTAPMRSARSKLSKNKP
tara:strand:- start:3310 stop:5106 length:1797 start_codon:yes stop_codon:yes gene_type:complete